MKHLLILLISILLLPISVFGFEWTVSYDMKKSDGRIEYLELSVPKVIKGLWELPNQIGNWTCWLGRNDYETHSNVGLLKWTPSQGQFFS